MSKIRFEIQIIDPAFPVGGYLWERDGIECSFDGFNFQCAYGLVWPWNNLSSTGIYHVESGTLIAYAETFDKAYRHASQKLTLIDFAILQKKIKLALTRKFKMQLQTKRNQTKGYQTK